jgi:hypothetical protein
MKIKAAETRDSLRYRCIHLPKPCNRGKIQNLRIENVQFANRTIKHASSLFVTPSFCTVVHCMILVSQPWRHLFRLWYTRS